VRVEQAVYGSFAFRGQGYAVLARSPGCRPEWVSAFVAACRGLGERPAGAEPVGGLFALRLSAGPWVVAGVSPQGRDDLGRPGALAFHGLFVSPRDYRRAGGDPFAFASALRSSWPHDVRELPALELPVRPAPRAGEPSPAAAAIARRLRRGRRVALEADGPIDDLAREVWRALPARTRARRSLATWAFGNSHRFDLAAAPKLALMTLDDSYAEPTPRPARVRLAVALAATLLLGAAAVGMALSAVGPPAARERTEPVHRPAAEPGDAPSPAAGGIG
jgi:hypothetical protein